MTGPEIVTVEQDYPSADRDLVWVAEVRERAVERLQSVPPRYQDSTVTCPEVADWVRAVVAEAIRRQRGPIAAVSTGPSLMLLGPTGTGKTHQAYGALRALAHSGVQCRWSYSTAADIYARLRPRSGVDSETEFDRLAKAPLLVIDDLGAAKGSEWTEEVNYRLINHRYEHMLPTLITSNLPVSELKTALGDRVSSRLNEMTTRAVLSGVDRRRVKTNGAT
ncbi:ATP-binding protein [Saccharopolyspora shandongensis]|uniref:ATP-binding protein n=1 Tax=Saccharopolyspora shandongensis TaxID=418495 RepID=UPI0034134C71